MELTKLICKKKYTCNVRFSSVIGNYFVGKMSQVFEFKLLLLLKLELALSKEDYKRICRFTSVKKGITIVFGNSQV